MMNSTTSSNRLDAIFSLLHSPLFAEFELLQEAPSVFRAVGRTHTETWHSAFLGWLLNPDSSHGLGAFPITRMLLLLKTQAMSATHEIDMDRLLAEGDFFKARARPNERDILEVSVKDVGRFDVFVDSISFGSFKSVQILIEMKVKAKIEPQQCKKYIAYIANEKKNGNFILPVFVAPTKQLLGTPQKLFGSDEWFALSYQDLYDELLEPCLQHPRLSDFGSYTLQEYVKTLKSREQGEEPLATTQREREIVETLFERHEVAIISLYEILSERQATFNPSALSSAKVGIDVKIKGMNTGDAIVKASSIADLYSKTLVLLDQNGYLNELQLPIESGTKRYLLATQPIHQQGNPMLSAAHYGDANGNDYYMEANKSRDTGLRDLSKLLSLCKLSMG